MYAVNARYQHILSTLCLCTPSIGPFNTPSFYTPFQHTLNTPFQHPFSTPLSPHSVLVGRGYVPRACAELRRILKSTGGTINPPSLNTLYQFALYQSTSYTPTDTPTRRSPYLKRHPNPFPAHPLIHPLNPLFTLHALLFIRSAL